MGWDLYALYGFRYVSISQNGALGTAEVGVLFLNNLGLNSEFRSDNWAFGFQFNSYEFSYKAASSGDSLRMSSINLYGSHKWVMTGLNIEQSPLFRNNSGSIEVARMTIMSLSAGIKKEIKLSSQKLTILKLKGWFSYPLNASSDNPEIKLNSIRGYGLHGELELNRQFISKSNYSLHVAWTNHFGAQRVSNKVEWSTSVGDTKSQIANASSSLGVLLKF
jgi:hypothetical protein